MADSYNFNLPNQNQIPVNNLDKNLINYNNLDNKLNNIKNYGKDISSYIENNRIYLFGFILNILIIGIIITFTILLSKLKYSDLSEDNINTLSIVYIM